MPVNKRVFYLCIHVSILTSARPLGPNTTSATTPTSSASGAPTPKNDIWTGCGLPVFGGEVGWGRATSDVKAEEGHLGGLWVLVGVRAGGGVGVWDVKPKDDMWASRGTREGEARGNSGGGSGGKPQRGSGGREVGGRVVD